jgi:GDP-4-dehydro-6-deoxy-D-mannose reductase
VQRVLVTGASGFVGGHLAERLARDGIEQIPYAGDVRDADALRAALAGARPDAVVHLAARSSVAESFSQQREVWDVNATGTLVLALAVRSEVPDARVLFISSGEVYGAVPDDRQPIAESAPVRPRSPYATSKAAAELALCSQGLDVVVARAFNHVGPGQDERFAIASFAAQVARAERGQQPPVLRVGDLGARRDLSDVRDVVDAYARLLQTPSARGVYNVASGRAHALRDVVERLLRLSRRPIAVEPDPARLRPADLPLLSGDASRLEAATGWQPTRSLDETLADVLEAARANATAAAGREAGR